MSSYTDIFKATVSVVNGCLAPEIKQWFESAGSPVLLEGDRVMVAEGADWSAFTSVRVTSGSVMLKFRFSNKPLATLFKLTWG